MTRARIVVAALLVTGALFLAAGALARGTPAGDDSTAEPHKAVIVGDDGDSAWVKVDRGPRLHIVTKDARGDEPRVIDIDLSNIGQVIADAMQEVSRSLENLHVRTEGPEGEERIIIDANGKETVVDIGRIMQQVDREVSHAMREADRQLERERAHRHTGQEPAETIREDRRALQDEQMRLQEEMDKLREEMSALRQEIGRIREQEQRRD